MRFVGRTPVEHSLNLVILHLVESPPALEVGHAHPFAYQLVPALAADVVECGVHHPSLRVRPEVSHRLLCHICGGDGDVVVRVDLRPRPERAPVPVRRGVDVSVLLVAGLDVVQQSLSPPLNTTLAVVPF